MFEGSSADPDDSSPGKMRKSQRRRMGGSRVNAGEDRGNFEGAEHPHAQLRS